MNIEEKIKEVEQHGFKVISNGEWNKFWELLFNYKDAWEELKQFNSRNETRTYEEAWILTSIQELEQKHGIEVKK